MPWAQGPANLFKLSHIHKKIQKDKGKMSANRNQRARCRTRTTRQPSCPFAKFLMRAAVSESLFPGLWHLNATDMIQFYHQALVLVLALL